MKTTPYDANELITSDGILFFPGLSNAAPSTLERRGSTTLVEKFYRVDIGHDNKQQTYVDTNHNSFTMRKFCGG